MISFSHPLLHSFSFKDKAGENVINDDASSNWRDGELSTDRLLLYLDKNEK
jgi:hypothetical protein